MAQITFRAKVRNGFIDVPQFKRSHCDMAAFRKHPRWGGLANSDLFPNVLARIRRDMIGSDSRNYIRLESLPAGVTVDCSGFLASVTVTVQPFPLHPWDLG
jgi:hypothetical protein